MKEVFSKKEDCYGCSACFNTCPPRAISMQSDQQGFLYPHIDEQLCVDCGLCTKVCPIGKEKEVSNSKVQTCFGMKNVDNIRNASSSGGIYTALSDLIKDKKQGVLVGARFDDAFRVIHDVAIDDTGRNKFRGSKYIQSNMNDIYIKVEECLKKQCYVLFTGTPCQVAGMKMYLQTKKVDMEYLVTNDIVCHGVPSPQIWENYVEHIESKYKGKLKEFLFRDKNIGWRGYHIKAVFDNGEVINDEKSVRSYAQIFAQDVMLRPSCYYCPYASMERCGDITIGDFWGIETLDKNFSDNKGISMVFANSFKGEEIINECLETYSLISKEYPTEFLTQPNLHKSTDFGKSYDKFWKDYLKHGYKYVAQKYGGDGKFSKIYHYLRAIKIRLERI